MFMMIVNVMTKKIKTKKRILKGMMMMTMTMTMSMKMMRMRWKMMKKRNKKKSTKGNSTNIKPLFQWEGYHFKGCLLWKSNFNLLSVVRCFEKITVGARCYAKWKVQFWSTWKEIPLRLKFAILLWRVQWIQAKCCLARRVDVYYL